MVYPDLPSPNRNEYSGVNAIHRTIPIINFLMHLQDELSTKETIYPVSLVTPSKVSSVTITQIEGGVSHSTVPDKCVLNCIINTIPELDLDEIKTRILSFSDEYRKKNPDIELTVQTPIFV